MHSKIAYVNIVRVINESVVGVQEEEHLRKVKQILVEAELAAQQVYTTMSEEDKQKNRAIDIANINQSWKIEQQNARSASVRKIIAEVESYRQIKDLEMVLDGEHVVSADALLDISEDIIDRLKDIHVEHGEIPSFTVKQPDNK